MKYNYGSNDLKLEFLTLIDGCSDYFPGIFRGLDTFKLGVCKLEQQEDRLHVWLRRPGLLIGWKGRTINRLMEEMSCKITVHEVDLCRQQELSVRDHSEDEADRKISACGDPECGASSGIHAQDDDNYPGLTFGKGHLDTCGYWSKPCHTCARNHEKKNPEDGPCWPFKDNGQIE